MTDDELTDLWEAGHVFGAGVTHEQHLRVAWVLHRRYGAVEAKHRLVVGTKRACDRHGCPEKFDAALTERWADAIAEAIWMDGIDASAEAFLEAHPGLTRGDLFRRQSSAD